MLSSLRGAGVRTSSLTLHVGAGTFKPVSSSTLEGHDMHAEPFSVSAEALASLAQSAAEGRCVRRGTLHPAEKPRPLHDRYMTVTRRSTQLRSRARYMTVT